MHTIFVEHSKLSLHSGRQSGGFPIKLGPHVQATCEPITRHMELGPHGFGTQGSIASLEGPLVISSTFIQRINGSPVNPFKHVQRGEWFTTKHFALSPQADWHGLTHLFSTQALLLGHSVLIVHSGRHVGGVPKKLDLQEHTPWPFKTRQLLFGPQGEGSQGSVFGASVSARSISQPLVASPVKSGSHEHDGAWLTTRQTAFIPQISAHGFMHLLLRQAFDLPQSSFVTHSGRHPVYGSPKYSGIQVHEPAPFFSLHIAFDPQGDPLHG